MFDTWAFVLTVLAYALADWLQHTRDAPRVRALFYAQHASDDDDARECNQRLGAYAALVGSAAVTWKSMRLGDYVECFVLAILFTAMTRRVYEVFVQSSIVPERHARTGRVSNTQ